MIQRIQSVFLFFAFLLVGLLFFVPFANLSSVGEYSFNLLGIHAPKSEVVIQQPVWLLFYGTATALLILAIIFLYKNRKLQMKLSWIAIVMALGLNAAMYILTGKYCALLNAEAKYSAVFVFPVIAAILIFLAYRSINKDEKLVKSLDRLR